MSDALTLAEARKQYNRAVEGPSQEKEEAAFVVLLAAYLRDLAGTPDSETMERAVEVLVCSPRLDFCSRCGDDGHQCHNCTVAGMWQDAERDLRLAYPLLVAPLRAEVERLKGERDLLAQYHGGHMPDCGGMDSVNQRCECGYLEGAAYRDLYDRLLTAEARVRELEDRLHLTRKLP